jgi:hypothetical protein
VRAAGTRKRDRVNQVTYKIQQLPTVVQFTELISGVTRCVAFSVISFSASLLMQFTGPNREVQNDLDA